MLEVKHVSKSFEKEIISDFSYKFNKKGLYVIRGASGFGKTTLLRLLGGLLKADAGEILLREDAKISFVFQDARLLEHLSLLDNILLVKKEMDKENALEILKKLGLDQDIKKRPSALSGGMKLRGALARSLYYGGDIYLWDEPTKELDDNMRKVVIKIINELSEKALVIVATHDKDIFSENEILL